MAHLTTIEPNGVALSASCFVSARLKMDRMNMIYIRILTDMTLNDAWGGLFGSVTGSKPLSKPTGVPSALRSGAQG